MTGTKAMKLFRHFTMFMQLKKKAMHLDDCLTTCLMENVAILVQGGQETLASTDQQQQMRAGWGVTTTCSLHVWLKTPLR